jgi:hypothetical protein
MTAGVKEAKRFFRSEIETSHESITVEITELRDLMKLFKKKTTTGSAAQANQLEQLSGGKYGGALDRMAAHFDSVNKAQLMLLDQECPRVFFPVSDEKRQELQRRLRKVKVPLRTLLQTSAVPEQDLTVVLANFWVENENEKTLIDQMFDDLKAYQEALKKFKGAVQRHIVSSAFTRTIHTERLIEKYNIGNEEREGEEANGADDLADGGDDGVTKKIVRKKKLTKEQKEKIDEVTLEESRAFIRANDDDDDGDNDRDDLESNEDDPNADAVEETSEEKRLLAKVEMPKNVFKRGGKMLRKRKIVQRENFKKMVEDIETPVSDDNEDGGGGGGDDDDDDEDADNSRDRLFKPKQDEDDEDDDDDDTHSSEFEDESSDDDDEDDDDDDDDGNDDDEEAADDDEDEEDDKKRKKKQQKPTKEKKLKLADVTTSHDGDDDDGVEKEKKKPVVKKEKITQANGVHAATTTTPAKTLAINNAADGTESDDHHTAQTTKTTAVPPPQPVEEVVDDFFI